MLLSVVIPCYNEKETLLQLLEKVRAVDLGEVKKEIIVVDDCSTDGTKELLKKLQAEGETKIYFHAKNQGKGSALKTGFKHATGDIIIVQDADLEYNPEDYKKLIAPIVNGEYSVVYGSRERNSKNKRHSGVFFYLGGRFLTILSNVLYGAHLTDESCCYKVFTKEVLDSIPLKCERFEFCPEVTAKVLKRKIPIKEVPVSYHPRKIEDGKKIRFTDGLEAIWTLIKYRFKN